MSDVGRITQLSTFSVNMPPPPMMFPDKRCDADIFAGRAYELRDVAQWLDLNGQKDLGRQVRDLAAKVYEISVEKRRNVK
jgi:hypothetical protein